jgi:hypothetical protein
MVSDDGVGLAESGHPGESIAEIVCNLSLWSSVSIGISGDV